MTAKEFIKKFMENNAPWLLACVTGVIHHYAWPQFYPDPEKATEFFGNVVNISGIAVGFLATGQTLLCSLNDNFVVQTLRKYDRFDGMLRFFTEAICWCLLLALFSLLTYWVNFKVHSLMFSVWLGLFVGAFSATTRILALFAKTLHGKKQ
jgi:hypothetical protein